LGSIAVIICAMLLTSGCYTLNGSFIPKEMKTIDIGFFENNAILVVPTLSQTFTEALKERVRSTTRLSISTVQPDARMSGTITDYRIAPVSIQATNPNQAPIAGASQLSITVKVKFVCDVCDKSKKIDFEDTFTKTANYSGDIANQETALIQTITKQLIDDIFNRAFNNW